jgi:sulfatase modifying factor 1
VTVGRFRNFKAAWDEGWEPRPGSGKHEHLNGELGLSNSEGSSANELGWKDSWDAYLTLSDESLACSTSAATWTTTSGANEKRPISCVNWFEAYAFCIWDGGFLPSEAEWNYAAAGGNDQRQYPWGATAPGSNTSRAVHGCYYGASGTCTGVANVAPVGSSPNGYGKYGQADLAGNVWEWVLDTWEADGVSFADDCNDCAYLPTTETYRVFRGGSYLNAASALVTTARYYDSPEFPNSGIGVRCARMP